MLWAMKIRELWEWTNHFKRLTNSAYPMLGARDEGNIGSGPAHQSVESGMIEDSLNGVFDQGCLATTPISSTKSVLEFMQ